MKDKIYLIPGLMCDKSLWKKLVPLIKHKYELTFLQIPQESSFEEIIKELDKKIEDNNANIIGFSLGGYLALSYCLKYKDKINKLLIISSTANALSIKEINKRETALKLIKKYGFKGLSKINIQSMIEETNNQELIDLIQNMYINLGKEFYIQQVSSTLIRENLSSKLIELNLPIHFVNSNKDILIDNDNLKKLKNNSFFKFKQFDSKTHMIPLEKYEELSNIILEWF